MQEMQETWVQSLVQEDSLEKGKAAHSSILYFVCLFCSLPKSAHTFYLFIIYLFIYFILFFIVVGFVIHWNESAMDLHVFPIPIPPPTSLSTRSL